MKQSSRSAEFARRPKQESILHELNALLSVAEEESSTGEWLTPKMPILFIVGAPRSGTTLMLQWLASSGHFSYPTNLLSRFYRAPYIGAKIQQLLTDPELDYRDELRELRYVREVTWVSEVGKTQGILQPHEFFYFWRRFFPLDQAQKLTEKQVSASDPLGFTKGWAALERAFDKPIAAKAILLQYDIVRLAKWLPTAVFIHTRREAFFNMQSLLQAREKVLGSREAWFSVRPPEFEELNQKDPYSQVAGQVFCTNQSIDAELRQLPSYRRVIVDYEAFCTNPSSIWREIQEAFSEVNYLLPDYDGPLSFECSNAVTLSQLEMERIEDAYDSIASTFPSNR